MLPTFLDLVVWGHEPDCQVTPEESLRGDFYVVQPGSSVATQLTPGETTVKHVAVIDIRLGHFWTRPLPLCVRLLMMGEINWSESGLKD